MNLLTVWALILAVRLLSVFVVQTYYVPDEYWQSLEVAHRLVYGYGYLSWEWTAGIRSYIYPLFFACLYKLLALLELETVHLMVLLPRLAQALLSAYSDYRFFVWSERHKWALFMILVPWFWFYIGSRTLTNTLEASLTTIALSYYPWETRKNESSIYLWLAALCCFLRPTAVIIWIPLCLLHLIKSADSVWKLLLTRFLPIGFVVGAACVYIDSQYHGRLIFTPYEFLKYNVFNNIGTFYGSHPWHWYFTVGLPTVLGINLLPFAYAAYYTIRRPEFRPKRMVVLITMTVALLALSAVPHKEFRFLAPILPLCFYVSADFLSEWSRKVSRPWLWLTAILILAGNALPAWYLSSVHQQGPIQLMPKLREIARTYVDEGSRRAYILFLMPCHSTPYYSHVHENVTMRFLTCEPNLQGLPDYKDEAEKFYDAPAKWLRSHIPVYPRHAMPTHVVIFEPLTRDIADFLINYKRIHHLRHAEYIEGRQGKYLDVYERLREDEPKNLYNRDFEEEEEVVEARKNLYPDLHKELEDNKRNYDKKADESTKTGTKNLYN